MRRKFDNRINIIINPDFKQKIRAKAGKETLTEVVIRLLKKWLSEK